MRENATAEFILLRKHRDSLVVIYLNQIIYPAEDSKLEDFCRDDVLVRIKLIFSRVLCAVKLGRVTCQDSHCKWFKLIKQGYKKSYLGSQVIVRIVYDHVTSICSKNAYCQVRTI